MAAVRKYFPGLQAAASMMAQMSANRVAEKITIPVKPEIL
jgi:hypothetical protein